MMHPKVAASATGATFGGAVATIIVWGLSLRGVVVPAEVSAAFATIIGALVGLTSGYLTPDPKGT